MTAVTICSDFGAQENKVRLFPLFPHLFAKKWWDWMPLSLFFECWVLSQLFHSPLSLSSRGFHFLFTFCYKSGVTCISEVIDISPGNIPACASFTLAFHMMYSAYKLNNIDFPNSSKHSFKKYLSLLTSRHLAMPKFPCNLVLPKMSISIFSLCQMAWDRTEYQGLLT